MIRCYNCGEVGHRTQQCTEYGPYFVEEGKTSQDYSEQTARIAQLFAEDIVTEHQAGHSGGESTVRDGDTGPATDPGETGARDHDEQAAVSS